jgi:hypothetical protein
MLRLIKVQHQNKDLYEQDKKKNKNNCTLLEEFILIYRKFIDEYNQK